MKIAPALAQTADANSLSNLLSNSAFQLTKPGEHGAPSGWTWEGPAELATIVADRPFQSFGNSLNFNFHDVDRSRLVWYCWSDYIAIDSGQSYLQSGWIKTEGSEKGFGASLARRFYDADKKLIPTPENDNFVARNVAPVAWEHFSQVLVPQGDTSKAEYKEDEIPAHARYMRVGAFAAYYPRQVWFNDLRLEVYNPAIAPFSYGDNKIVRPAAAEGQQVKVDGQLEEALWKTQEGWQSGFVRTVCPEAEVQALPAALQTSFKIAHDKDNIYLAARCNAPDPAALKSPTQAHNDEALYSGETVEFFLDASGKRQPTFHLSVNPAGAYYEEWARRAINLGLKVAATKTATGWQTEIAIPRQTLWQLYHEAGSDVNNELWSINVARSAPGAGADQYSSWSYTGPSGFANDQNLGFLLIGKPQSILLNELSETQTQLRQFTEPAAPKETKFVPAEMTRLRNSAKQIEHYNAQVSNKVRTTEEISTEEFIRCLLTTRRSVPAYKKTFDIMQRLLVKLPPDRERFGYVLFRTPLFERPNKERIPSTPELFRKLTLQMAANEHGQANFSIFTKTDLKDIQITWGDLKNAQGRAIAQKEIDVRIVETWGGKSQADIMATDLRIPLKGWQTGYAAQQRFIPLVAQDTSRKIWITVKPGKSLPPGVYKGTIKVQPANKPATTLPLEITVLPFELPATSRKVGFYYCGVLESENQPPLGSASYMFYNGLTTPESCLRELKALRQAGFTMITFPDYAHGPLNPDYTRQVLTLAREAGIETIAMEGSEHIITKAVLTDPQKLEASRAVLKQRIERVCQIAKEVGTKTLYIYGSDEPNDEEDYERNRIISEVVHEAGAQMGLAMIFESSYNAVSKYTQLSIMNWASMTADADATRRFIEKNKEGKNILYYANLTAHHTALQRLTFGLYLYKSGLGGNLPWAYYYLGLNWEPFTEEYHLDAAYFAIPTKDDPISTLKFESAVAGVTDLRYCEMLEKLIASCPDKAKAAQAQKEFDDILRPIELLNKQGINSANYMMAPEVLEASRARLQQLVGRMNKSGR